MKKRSSRCNSDTFKLAITNQNQMQSTGTRTDKHNVDNSDISLLQRPLTTAYAGFEEARRAYEDGTNEVRRLLSQECSLIYECNVCRNMFRSLANFISHKRVFCCISARSASQNGGYTDQNSTMIIQSGGGGSGSGPSTQDIEYMLRSRSTGCSPVPREARPIRGGIRDLSGVIERLRREKATTAMRSSPTVLQLEPVPTSSQAVYQTIKVDHDDSIKTEVNEVHLMLNPEDTVVGPDGKAVVSHHTNHKVERRSGGSDSGENGEQSISDDAETSIFCEICNLTFQTHKTLELHIQKHHSSSAFVFQCPACSLTFLQAAAVIRHLSKDHKKPTRRIRMMRNTILKRRVQQGDIQPKGPSRELKRLQLSDDVVGHVPEQVIEGREQRKIMSLCIYCEKSFERRAALSTHLLNCRAKQEALAKPAPNVKGLKLKQNSSNASSLDQNDESDPANAAESTLDLDNIKLDPSLEEACESDSNALNEMFADLAEKSESFAAGLQTVSLDKLQLQNETDSASDEASNSEDEDEGREPDPEPLAEESISKVKGKKKRTVPIEKQMRCRCKICHKQFNALGNLRRHISMFHYRARRFGCTLCDYRAFRRYDIINHLGFIHKIDGDREMLTEKYVSTHECEYSRDDVDGDIVLLDAQSNDQPEGSSSATEIKTTPKASEKRAKRSKTLTETGPILEEVVIKEEPDTEPIESTPSKKRRKSRSLISPESGEQTAEKRPIRRRVKAVNKDFVYDIPSFKADASGSQQQQEQQQPQQQPQQQQQQQQPSTTPAVENMRAKLRRPAPSNDENKPKIWEDITEEKKHLVQGITRRIMLELVSQGRAVSATLPELPAERPQIRPRLTSYTRTESDQQSQPNVVTEPESFIEKIAKRTAAAGKDTAVISNLWNKVNTAIAQQQQQQQQQMQQDVSVESKEENDAQLQPNGKESPHHPAVCPPPSEKSSASVPVPEQEESQAPTTTTPLLTTERECLSSTSNITEATGPPTSKFPALPKPPSVLQATASGTIQFTLDSLLRAALQN